MSSIHHPPTACVSYECYNMYMIMVYFIQFPSYCSLQQDPQMVTFGSGTDWYDSLYSPGNPDRNAGVSEDSSVLHYPKPPQTHFQSYYPYQPTPSSIPPIDPVDNSIYNQYHRMPVMEASRQNLHGSSTKNPFESPSLTHEASDWGKTRSLRHTLRGLYTDTSYEATVTVENKYGWSEVSDMFTFYTKPG